MPDPDSTLLSRLSTSLNDRRAGQYDEPTRVVRRRRVAVVIFVIIGAGVLGFSLSIEPGDTTFYLYTLLLAAVWVVGAFVSGPIHLGHLPFRGHSRRPVVSGLAVGVLIGGVFVVGAFVVRLIPPIADLIGNVLAHANQGNLAIVTAITVINGVAEELFFRGAVYSAFGAWYPVVASTVLYILVTLASGNVMLGFAAILLGTVCALERRVTGGVLAPALTHFVWGAVMVLALPPIFGV
ncbi:CPBP family intramembrane glutamic endopeptidase [Williamsia sterculiae]|uniref:CAAX prenyl protease 2/Lysostaphin resistance protein A-like domain-containing protein n=1 Tax=Williamsia sterculiae TaxID=1344003 RepID=A0A1N7FCT1_9NOCA|nr:type II CAAX endopeptidase family protein [Williamsia sterculiae]SIR98147.1 hypothetical protein SAMN05445060_1940 [Williamsia sterculiae]